MPSKIGSTIYLSFGALVMLGCSSSAPDNEDIANQISSPNAWQEKLNGEQVIDFDSRWGIVVPEQTSKLLGKALIDNFDVQISSARLVQVQADQVRANASFLPDFRVSASKSHRETFVGDEITNRQSSSIAVSASWELDLWQRLGDISNSADLKVKASELDLQALKLSIQGQVLSAWLDIIETEQLQALIKRNIKVQTRRLELSERRLDLGLVGSVDVRNGRNTLEGLKATLTSSNLTLKRNKRKLQVLLSEYPSGLITIENDLPDLLPLPVLDAPQSILLNRPDIQSAMLSLQAAGFEVDAAKKAMLPRISFNGSYGVNNEDFDELFDLDHWLSSITGSLVQPIFYRGALQADVDRKKAAADIAMLRLKSNLLKAWQEIENNIASEYLLAQRQAHLQEALIQAKAAEAQTERDYELGLATSFELLATQRSSISNENDLIRVNTARLKNRVSLMLAIGIVNEQELLEQQNEGSKSIVMQDAKLVLKENFGA